MITHSVERLVVEELELIGIRLGREPGPDDLELTIAHHHNDSRSSANARPERIT